MELSEKIQKLRKDLGLTQEQFAERLFVSRTAVSKWETGRGTPSMESLQMIAKLCETTLDELLRTEEVIVVATNENKENLNRFASRINGIFDLAAILGLFLPLYKVKIDNIFHSVPLYQFEGWLTVIYWSFPAAVVICGIIQLLINNSNREKLKRNVSAIGSILNVLIIFILILSNQPYPAVLFLTLLLVKGTVMLMKQN